MRPAWTTVKWDDTGRQHLEVKVNLQRAPASMDVENYESDDGTSDSYAYATDSSDCIYGRSACTISSEHLLFQLKLYTFDFQHSTQKQIRGNISAYFVVIFRGLFKIIVCCQISLLDRKYMNRSIVMVFCYHIIGHVDVGRFI